MFGRGQTGTNPVLNVGLLQPVMQVASEIPKSFAIWFNGASPLRATATTSRRNSAGNGFGRTAILSVKIAKILTR
jgi:hypothetical protein